MITIFTGAGASKALGYPTTAEFFTLGTGLRLKEDHVYQRVQKFLMKDVLDVEDVLRLLYPIAELHDTPTGKFIFPHFRGQWYEGIPEFVTRTNAVCFDHYGREPKETDVSSAYVPLLNYCGWQNQKISLFTANYDPVTDVLMKIAVSNGITSHDGFDRFGEWDSGSYSGLKTGGLAIYRLHGSMSWVENEGKIRNTRDYSRRAPGYAEHLLIYPGFKGNPERDGHSAFKFAHTALRKELGESHFMLAIGFSFRDPHLNDIFRESLRTNRKLKIVVWNPIWPEGPEVGLEELRQEFGNRIIAVAQRFGTPEAITDLQHLIGEPGVDPNT